MTMKTRKTALQADHVGAMRAFVKVVEAGSFSAVAREMRQSTSTIARKVSAIEDVLGVSLMHRSTHSVTLTEAGQIYFDRAVTLLADLEDTLRVVAEVNTQPSGPLKLTAPMAFGRRHLSPLIADFLKIYPSIQLDVRLTDNHNDLVSGGFDLDIHEGENYLDNLVVHKLSRNDSILCASPTYLDRRGRPTSPINLAHHNCLRYVHPEADLRWHLSSEYENHSILPTGNLASDHSELLLDAVIAGLGIAEFEVWLVRDQIMAGRLEPVLKNYKLHNKLTGDFIYLAYLGNRRDSAKVRALKDFLVENLKHVGQLSDMEMARLRIP